jgi:catechol 2,3-dioxygenase-like lactoylglutathione lyase family enzyme
MSLKSAKLMAFVPTLDFDRSRAFYESVLGLRFVDNDGFAMTLDANGVHIRVAKVQKDFKPAGFTILGWEVTSIAKAAEALRKRGVKFEQFGLPQQDADGIWSSPSGAKVAWFKDPDGNVLSISQHV